MLHRNKTDTVWYSCHVTVCRHNHHDTAFVDWYAECFHNSNLISRHDTLCPHMIADLILVRP
jgi:hypothetical protein